MTKEGPRIAARPLLYFKQTTYCTTSITVKGVSVTADP